MGTTIKKRDWILDIQGTETWLNHMYSQGFALEKANLSRGKFVFERDTPCTVYHKIGYGQSNVNSPEAYVGEGFETVCRSGNYYVLRTDNADIPFSPSFNNLSEKTSKSMFSVKTFLLIYLLTVGVILSVLLIFMVIDTIRGNLVIEGFIGGLFVVAIPTVPIWILLYKLRKLKKINAYLETLCDTPLDLSYTAPGEMATNSGAAAIKNQKYASKKNIPLLSKQKIAELKKEGLYLKKRNPFWQYSPDITENWLEITEAQGYNLIGMNRWGSFIFRKGSPRKMKFQVDYLTKRDHEYFNIHKESGWELFYNSPYLYSYGISIWAQEYTGKAPEFYSDKTVRLKQAKRMALAFSLSFGLLFLLYAFLVIMFVIQNIGGSRPPSGYIINIFTHGFLFLSHYINVGGRILAYYFRIKKSVQNEYR